MEIGNNAVVSLRYIMKDDKGEIIGDNTSGKPIEYLHGSGSILPSLEQSLAGLKSGQTKSIIVSDENLRSSFYFDVIVDQVRPAEESEINRGKPLSLVENKSCGPGCDC